MRKLTYSKFVFMILIILYFIHITNNFKNKLTTSEEIGYSTFYYIFHPTMYPKFYSEYLFNKYEYPELLRLQKHSPIPYKTIITAYSYNSDGVLDETTIYKERINRLENNLVCIGLSRDCVNEYQAILRYHHTESYQVKKYKKLDYDSLFNYCKNNSKQLIKIIK